MKEYNLERRTTLFSKAVIRLCMSLPRHPMNDRLIGQVVGSSGSIGANYREANDALGEKDFAQRLKISRREAKETEHWLELVSEANPNKADDIVPLLQEAKELRLIISAILNKTTRHN